VENRRLLFAAILSALVLITWNMLFAPPPAKRPPEQPPADQPGTADRRPVSDDRSAGVEEERPAPEREGLLPPLEDRTGEPPASAEPLVDFGEETVAAELEERSVIETETVRAEFTNRGAQLVSLRLKKHFGTEGESLEMVKDRGSDPYPFALVAGGERSHRLNRALFVASEGSDEEGNPQLRFRHQSDRGAAEKLFRWTPDGLLEVEVTVVGETDWSVFMGPGLRNLSEGEDDRFMQRGVGYRRGEELELLQSKKQKEDVVLPAFGLGWLTLEDNFFLNAVIPRSGVEAVLVRPVIQRAEYRDDQPRFLPIGTEIGEEDQTTDLFLLLQSAGERLSFETLFTAKRYSRLVKLPYGLEQTVRWGWFGFLAKPLYFGLEWIHQRIVPNYGWSIVLITFAIKLLFFPLTHKSQESMGKMQELNPKVQAIRTKYRPKLKDKQGRPNLEAQRKMNEEVMAVYKSAGVNPASGCIPLLFQMPVFFAFFRVLSTAVELRKAPWIAWVKDLSRPDPFFVLPIIMGVTSIAMQRMMPSSPDPMQRRLMQMMPIMFTVFALAFPSGLVLYWVTNNLLTMAQQALLMKMKKRKAES
jgi:YidC/Oxa1 family membrane protein insertase